MLNIQGLTVDCPDHMESMGLSLKTGFLAAPLGNTGGVPGEMAEVG